MSFFVRDAGEGAAYDFAGAQFIMKATGEDTGVQLAVMEMRCPGPLDVPAHVHNDEDELFYVLSGDLAGFCGEQRCQPPLGRSCSYHATSNTGSRSPTPLTQRFSWLSAHRGSTHTSRNAARRARQADTA